MQIYTFKYYIYTLYFIYISIKKNAINWIRVYNVRHVILSDIFLFLVASSIFCVETNWKSNAASSGWYSMYVTYIHTYTHVHTYIQYTAIVSWKLTVRSMTSQLLHLCLYVICLDRDLYKKHRRSMNSRDEQPLLLQFLMNDWINEMKDICASSSRRAPLGSGRGDICGLGMMCQKTL